MKKIKKVRVKVPGSPPDVDTDFHTVGREKVIQYCVEKYGHENVANIITFSTFKAKNSFKSMCTIYNVQFALANRVTKTLPAVLDGEECTLAELFDETSPRYHEGEDFRNATDNDEWRDIVKYAIPLSGRVRGTGVHACGVIISKDPLSNTIPTQVRQKDEKLVTQWTYPQCESLGLIKMDFLGLDTLDIIDSTVENIRLMGKEVPDMQALTDGEMDDEKTFEMLQNGDTVGIFQLGGDGVRELLKRVKPTEFMDIAATTALYRPGPMKMNAHNQYADRKNGREKIQYICDSFAGTAVEEILKPTYGLIVYQEQCMQIATKFAGMTPYESDLLRKAIGKKKMSLMMSLQPKFIDGITDQGFSERDAEELWQTIEVFGQYGFNKSHSISYAINAYQTCYLKANYPAEFMAALLQQNTGESEKIAEFLQEAQSMGLRVGPVDVNASQVFVSSSNDSEYDIIYGFSAVKQVNETISEIIVEERDKNGKYKSVSDFIKRVSAKGSFNSGALKMIAASGGFDCFNVSRSAIIEKAPQLLKISQKGEKQSTNLFDLIGSSSADLMSTVDLTGDEFPYNELIKIEAEAIGLFISGHPNSNVGILSRQYSPKTILDLKTKELPGRSNVLATFTIVKTKVKRNGARSVAVRIDDGESTYDSYLPKQIVQRLEKGAEIERIKKAQLAGEQVQVGEKSSRADELIDIYYDDSIIPIPPLVKNDIYRVEFAQMRRGDSVRIGVTDVEKLDTAYDGSLPYKIKIPAGINVKELRSYLKENEGETYIHAMLTEEKGDFMQERVAISRDFIIGLEKIIGAENIITKGI